MTPENLTAAGVPPRFHHCSKESWDGTYPPELDGIPGDWDFVLIHGPAGTGKTHLAVSELIRSGCRPGNYSYTPTPNPAKPYLYHGSVPKTGAIFRDVQEAVERMKPPEPIRLEGYFDAEFLAFDDLGAERLTDFTIDRVSLILRHRFNHCRRTLLTTNLAPKQIVDIDPRLASRLLSGVVIQTGGKDRRL